jgi:hypothetical protein
MTKTKYITKPDGTYCIVTEGRRTISETAVTYPIKFSLADVEVTEQVPRVPCAGELYCLVDSRPAKAQFQVFTAEPGIEYPPAWILQVRTDDMPPKIFTPEMVDAIRVALDAGDVTTVFRLLDACPSQVPEAISVQPAV